MIDEKKLIGFINSKEFQMRIVRSQKSVQEILCEFIEEQPKIGGWIPCSDRLPEEKGWYLVYAKNQIPFVAYFKGKTFPLNNHYHEIVAWMPLPEPYEEKENG